MRAAIAAIASLALAGCGGGDAPVPRNSLVYHVETASMLPLYEVDAEVIIDTTRRLPQRNDVIAFQPPADLRCAGRDVSGSGRMCAETPEKWNVLPLRLERVVAVAGDRVAMRGGTAVVNGHLEASHPMRPCVDQHRCFFPEPIEVPAGTVYVLGDNRGKAVDSRFFGPVPLTEVVGTAARET